VPGNLVHESAFNKAPVCLRPAYFRAESLLPFRFGAFHRGPRRGTSVTWAQLTSSLRSPEAQLAKIQAGGVRPGDWGKGNQ
jgi:hypothetical protein